MVFRVELGAPEISEALCDQLCVPHYQAEASSNKGPARLLLLSISVGRVWAMSTQQVQPSDERQLNPKGKVGTKIGWKVQTSACRIKERQ